MATISTNLKLIIEAQDKTSAELAKINKSLGDTSKSSKDAGNSFGSMAGAMAAGQAIFSVASSLISAVAGQMKSFVSVAMEEEVAQVKVNAILQTLTGSLVDNEKAVKAAGEAALKLGFDDEAATISMARLMQTTGDTGKANIALENAMDLARAKNLDLETATKMTTMAYAGNVKTLKEMYGVDLPEGVKGMEAMGLMHDKVAGQAENFRNTTAGAMAEFKERLDNVKGAIGDTLITALTPFINTITEFVKSEKFQEWLNKVTTWLNENLTPAINNIIKVYNWLKDKLTEIYNWFTSNETIMKAVTTAFDVMQAVINDYVIPLMKTLWEWVKEHEKEFTLLAEIVGVIMLVGFGLLIGGIVAAIAIVVSLIVIITSVIDKFKEWNDKCQEVIGNIGDWFQGLGDKLAGVVDWIMGKINDLIDKFNEVKNAAANTPGLGTVMGWVGFGGNRATGGPVNSGTPYIVGEAGPELFVPKGNGTIVPNKGATVNFYGNNVFNNELDMDIFIRKIEQKLGRRSELARINI